MITIQGLTDRQRSIMDLLWGIQDLEQVQEFIKSLPTKQDQWDAASMVEIAVQATYEHEGYLEQFAAAAGEAIRNAQRP